MERGRRENIAQEPLDRRAPELPAQDLWGKFTGHGADPLDHAGHRNHLAGSFHKDLGERRRRRADRESKFTATVTFRFEPSKESALDLVWQNPTGFLVTDYRLTAESLQPQEG
ncbi:VirB8/TrbF family protein (plasmid) [Rhodobacter capsulatus]|uniref:VirB8/TrbF family protein n=1 Tax=Rhodobacter capsulatus TaxID=1061 RepID=UPI00402544BB